MKNNTISSLSDLPQLFDQIKGEPSGPVLKELLLLILQTQKQILELIAQPEAQPKERKAGKNYKKIILANMEPGKVYIAENFLDAFA